MELHNDIDRFVREARTETRRNLQMLTFVVIVATIVVVVSVAFRWLL